MIQIVFFLDKYGRQMLKCRLTCNKYVAEIYSWIKGLNRINCFNNIKYIQYDALSNII